MDTPVNVRLKDQELLDRARRLGEMLDERDRMVAEEKRRRGEAKQELDELDNEISAAGRVLRDGFETRRQGDLFVDQMPAADRPAGAVTDPSPEDAGETTKAQSPAPSEPHEFAFVDALDAEAGKPCTLCGASYMDPVHHGGDPLAGTPQASVSPDVAKSMLAAAAKLAPCPACAAWLCRIHPHSFNPDADHGGDRCTCGFAKRAKVHRVEVEAEPGSSAPSPDAEAVAGGNGANTAYDFDESEEPPKIIRSARAVETGDAEVRS